MTLTLVLPFAPRNGPGAPASPAARSAPSRDGSARQPVLGLVDNGKLKAGTLLAALGDALLRRGAISDYFLHSKAAMVPINEGERDAICARADIVIAGLGDCGGCTACSVTDAIRCLDRGVPAFMLATRPFAFLVEATASQYAADGLERLYVDHPVWSRSPDWFSDAGERLAEQVLAAIGGEPTPQRPDPGPPPADLALQALREAMDADGYDLAIVDDGESVAITVLAREGVCGTCLIPEAAFAKLALGALRGHGREIAADRVVVSYCA